VYGKRYPESVENAVLDKFNLQDIVHLHDPVSHDEALRHMSEADLLFMALPNRLDGSPGGRISAKTYEYLRTDRPILGALPPGENREYLRDKPGVHLTPPDGIEDMADVMEHLATDSFNGRSIAVDRSELHPALSSTARAQKFEQIVAETAHKSSAQLASSPPPSAD
jgi:glycosyltransferase involved in cell wall biosynthesis